VGYGRVDGDNDYHAFSWTAADGVIDLGTFGGRRSVALAVNSRGLVIGTSDTADGATHATLWQISPSLHSAKRSGVR
jgi:probable HAF family extracellular repeat protein